MTKDATFALHRGLVGHLKKGREVRRHLGDPPRIFDSPANKEVVPRLEFGECRARAWSSATFDGQEHDIVFNLYTGEGGAAASKEAAGAIIDRLHAADFPVPGHALVDLQFESSETRFHGGGEGAHCRLAFRALTVSD